jgi:16S rRNA (guanine966-N2)-methyltransferase
MKIAKPVRTELRIVAGSLRGRKITVTVHAGLRPTPQRVRESLFSILGNAVPGRAFIDLFAGTGIVGLEAVSRGASEARLIEGDAKNVAAIQKSAAEFGIADRVQVLKADAYRWAERWLPPPKPVTVFISPPFPDLEPARLPLFLALVETLRAKLPPDSVLVIQAEDGFPLNDIADIAAWDVRKYGRNLLMFWTAEMSSVGE